MVVFQSWALRSVPLKDRLSRHVSAAKEITPAAKNLGGVADPSNPSLSLVPVWAFFVTADNDPDFGQHGGLMTDVMTKKKTWLIVLKALSLRNALESRGPKVLQF